MIGAIGAGAGVGIVVGAPCRRWGATRMPPARSQTNMIPPGIAFAEAIAIYCLVVALLILFVF